MSFRVGQRVKVAKDNDNYNYNSFKKEILKISRIVPKTDPAYDRGVYPNNLYELKTIKGEDIDFALYDYELEKA